MCACVSSTAEELVWGLGLGHLPPVHSAHCMQGWEWHLGPDQVIPTPCESGKASSFPQVEPHLSTAPFSLPMSISPTGLSSSETWGPLTCVPASWMDPGSCAYWGMWPEGLTDNEGVRGCPQLPPQIGICTYTKSPSALSVARLSLGVVLWLCAWTQAGHLIHIQAFGPLLTQASVFSPDHGSCTQALLGPMARVGTGRKATNIY